MKKRLNTQLESEGAEFLVLGHLLIEGISAYKAYHNFKSYDLIANNPDLNKSVKIQIKSRFTTNWNGFLINDFNCDFVVFVALNRGYKKIKKNGDKGILPPNFYVFPADYLENLPRTEEWGKIKKTSFWEDAVNFENNWGQIKDKLNELPCNHPTSKTTEKTNSPSTLVSK